MEKMSISPPKRTFARAAAAVTMVVVVAGLLLSALFDNTLDDLGMLDVVGICGVAAALSLVTYATGELIYRHLRWVGEKVQVQIRQQNPDVLFAGYAKKVNSHGIASRSTTGLLAITAAYLSYSPGVQIGVPASITIYWTEVNSLEFCPKLNLVGRVRLQLRSGEHLSWQIDDSFRMYEALSRL